MEYSIDPTMNRFLNDYDASAEHYIYDDFDIDELENQPTFNVDNLVDDVEEGINFFDM